MEFLEVCKAVVLNDFSALSEVSAQDLNQLHEEKRMTPLAWAVNNKKTEMAKFLLEKGADPNMCAEEKPSPLLIAIKNEKLKMATLLLEKGADPNMCVEGESSPLLIAIENKNARMVELLLTYGADANLAIDFYSTKIPLYEAICGVVYRGLSANVAPPLIVRELLKFGANPNGMPGKNYIPLEIAVAKGYLKIVELLLEYNADLNVPEGLAQRLLCTAVDKKLLKITRLLLEQGINPNITFEEKAHPLLKAAHQGYEEMVELLLNNGADPNVFDKDLGRPLHVAVENWQEAEYRSKLVERLLRNGSNSNLLDAQERLPLQRLKQVTPQHVPLIIKFFVTGFAQQKDFFDSLKSETVKAEIRNGWQNIKNAVKLVLQESKIDVPSNQIPEILRAIFFYKSQYKDSLRENDTIESQVERLLKISTLTPSVLEALCVELSNESSPLSKFYEKAFDYPWTKESFDHNCSVTYCSLRP